MAVTAPSFARPYQVAMNSGRFSISSATTSPRPMPCALAQRAVRLAAASSSALVTLRSSNRIAIRCGAAATRSSMKSAIDVSLSGRTLRSMA